MVFRGGRTISRKVEMRGTYGVLHLDSSEFLFDAEDLPLIESRNWYRDKDGYLVSCYYFSGRTTEKEIFDCATAAKTTETAAVTLPTPRESPGCFLINAGVNGSPILPTTTKGCILADMLQKKMR